MVEPGPPQTSYHNKSYSIVTITVTLSSLSQQFVFDGILIEKSSLYCKFTTAHSSHFWKMVVLKSGLTKSALPCSKSTIEIPQHCEKFIQS